MPSVRIPRDRFPGLSDKQIAEALYVEDEFRYFAFVRYRNELNAEHFTHFGLCEIPEHLVGYLNSPHCHDAEVLLEYPILTEHQRLDRLIADVRANRDQAPPDVEQMFARNDVPGLIDILGTYHSEAHRVLAAECLGSLGDPRSLDALVAALEDEAEWVRKGAAKGLALMAKTHNVLPRLEAVLRDGSSRGRKEVTDALGEIGNASERQRVVVDLLIVALCDTDPAVRQRAAYTLSASQFDDDPRAVAPLIRALHDDDARVRSTAAHALGPKRNAQSVQPLIAALRDDDPEVRESAAGALGESADSRAVEALITASNDPESAVRARAALSLRLIDYRRATANPISSALEWLKNLMRTSM